MNPILPLHHFIPDVEARTWGDGRIYLYGSMDRCGVMDYCSDVYHVFSSQDMRDWTDHGIAFTSRESHAEKLLYAPDCVRIGDSYHLFYCAADKSEGVARACEPFGPFRDGKAIPLADKDGIDPAVFVDDDGEVYYFWGQYNLRGARLVPDSLTLDPSTLQDNLLSESEHGFHEGASIRTRDGIYYMVYTDISRGKASCLAYATSRHPLGPYEKRGIIIDNDGCDPHNWNNHGSIAPFRDQWYVFYHRASKGSRYNRRVCVEPIRFDACGDIAEVEMTTQGCDGPLPARVPLEACRACRLSGGIRADVNDEGTHVLSGFTDGDWAAYAYIEFDDEVSHFQLQWVNAPEQGRVDVRIDQPDGPLLCTCLPENDWSAHLSRRAQGAHRLHLVFSGFGLTAPELRQFEF